MTILYVLFWKKKIFFDMIAEEVALINKSLYQIQVDPH